MSICCADTYEGEDSRPFSLDLHLKLDSEFQSVYIKKKRNNNKVDVDFIHKNQQAHLRCGYRSRLMRGSGGLALSTGYRSLTAILTSSASSVRNRSRFRMVYSWSARMMLPWKWTGTDLQFSFYTKQPNKVAQFQAYYSHPVIQFNNQVVGSLIRAELDVNNPVNTELFNLSQSPCLQVFSTLMGEKQ